MKWADTLLAWALALLGAAQLLAPLLSKMGGPNLGAALWPWSGSVAVAIVTMGLMNAVRAQRRKDQFLRWMTVVATALTTGLCMAILYRFSGNVLHYPAALAVEVLGVLALFFAVAV